MEILFGVAGLIAAVFVVIFGGRGLVDLVKGAREPKRAESTELGEHPTAVAAASLHQDIHFTMTNDGVRIAYSTAGEGPLLVKISPPGVSSRGRLGQPHLGPPAERVGQESHAIA